MSATFGLVVADKLPWHKIYKSNIYYYHYHYYYIIALSQILSTLQIISHLVHHKPTK